MTLAIATDNYACLNYFYMRSPWYAAQRVGTYPVLRLDAAQAHALSSDPATPDL